MYRYAVFGTFLELEATQHWQKNQGAFVYKERSRHLSGSVRLSTSDVTCMQLGDVTGTVVGLRILKYLTADKMKNKSSIFIKSKLK